MTVSMTAYSQLVNLPIIINLSFQMCDFSITNFKTRKQNIPTHLSQKQLLKNKFKLLDVSFTFTAADSPSSCLSAA